MAKSRVAILISGRGSNMAALIYAARAEACPYEIALVSGDKPAAGGLDLAEAEGVQVERLSSKELGKSYWDTLESILHRYKIDYVALAGFMRIVPDDFAERWSNRMLNIHPSLLPKYKGLHTHQTAIENGDTVTGATVHLVIPELDSGEILGQVEVAIMPGDDEASLAERVLIAEHQLYPRILGDFVSRTNNPDYMLDKVRKLALALPEGAEKLSHGTPGFHIEKGKFFAYFSNEFYGEGPALLVKTSGEDEQGVLIEQDPELYFRPKYLGPSGWVGIRMSADVDWAHIEDWLTKSWRFVAPKRLADLRI